MREICTSGSMSGEWKRSMAELVRHRQTKEPETDRLRLNHRDTPRLYVRREWCVLSRGCKTRTWRWLSARKQSKSIGR